MWRSGVEPGPPPPIDVQNSHWSGRQEVWAAVFQTTLAGAPEEV